MLDPAAFGIMLLEFALRGGDGLGRVVEHDGSGAGRALVDGEKIRRAQHVQFAPNAFRLGTSSVTPRARFHDVWEPIASQGNIIW